MSGGSPEKRMRVHLDATWTGHGIGWMSTSRFCFRRRGKIFGPKRFPRRAGPVLGRVRRRTFEDMVGVYATARRTSTLPDHLDWR
ncbi:MAG: hypothetical protein CM1200mP29_07930 [Verrucomicrobiota bacterium]|nr:MAG: hypothetical protein CM1200mP29_07930 [Verrucomicrobiota bacterium]